MARAELTAQAQDDLRRIVDHTALRWSPEQAKVYLAGLRRYTLQLARTPRIGRPRDELAPGVLSFPIQEHVVYYVESPAGITVLRYLHKRQDPGERI